MKVVVEREFAGRTISLTTGEMAKQAAGAVLVQFGDTVVFVAAQNGPSRPGTDFFPLTCDYRERSAAAGKFPGGFIKREGRPTQKEILTSRLTDRPIRPLFPDGYFEEVQVMSNVLSVDSENDPDVLSIIGASAALGLAPVPFNGPIAAVRVGLIGEELILMPTRTQMVDSRLDLIVAGSKDSVLMIEGFAQQLPEAEMADAIMFAHRAIVELCALQDELKQKVGRADTPTPEVPVNPFDAALRDAAYNRLREAKVASVKADRRGATKELKDELFKSYFPDDAATTANGWTRDQFSAAFENLQHRVVRDLILEDKRLDGRSSQDLRAVSCQVGLLPIVHGSALFTRGETQSLATITLGTIRDAQRVEGLFDEVQKRFMLDYNFPSYSVGECRPIRGPGRREIGHGALAERSVQSVIPSEEKFPYTIRIISDIMESNGSSSMASVCSATLSLMDAGVPITQPVAGISIGLVKEKDKYVLLTDIMGDEDHHGDMDFKVAGTQKGVTGIQLDLKIDGINEEIIRATLEQARKARIELLKTMLTSIRRPRAEISTNAPRLLRTKIDPAKIGLLIGPGGKTIRAIQEETGATIDIADDGTVMIACSKSDGAEDALARVEAMTEEIKVGRIYNGTVSSVKDFGAFIEIAPGKDGLCHISELSTGYVKSVDEICKAGDKLQVKVIAIDDQNRVKLSRKAVLIEQGEGQEEAPPKPESEPEDAED
ncbi:MULTISPECIES: polyribonucleotide nucleotidyltransferase [unclassified Schlesneria]|uniref:polyribonucleotide nucleotidyltransferase n=1 Tax=Schlesneria TaxID=656899 RepID=UPI002F18A961